MSTRCSYCDAPLFSVESRGLGLCWSCRSAEQRRRQRIIYSLEKEVSVPDRHKSTQRMNVDDYAALRALVKAWGGSANAAINRAVREAAQRVAAS